MRHLTNFGNVHKDFRTLSHAIPQMYDQHYWAQRVHHLGIGIAHAPCTPTTDSFATALKQTLQPEVAIRARSIATTLRTNGAQVAAQRLMAKG